jgi:cytoskeletal protein CcmA (bactofilin family)
MSQPNVIEIHSGIVLKGQLSMVKDVVLTGKFEGDLQTLGCLKVAPGGAVVGSINAGALVLEPGNLVQARVKVGPPPKAMIRAIEEKSKQATGLWSDGFRKLKELALGRN